MLQSGDEAQGSRFQNHSKFKDTAQISKNQALDPWILPAQELIF